MSLRLENGVGCCYDGGSATTSPTSDVDTAPPVSPGQGDSTSRVCSKENLLGVSCRTMILGQILSLLIAMMSISAASLDDRGISIPSFVNFVNYSFIMALFFFPMLFSWFQGSLQLALPWWRYAFYALVSRCVAGRACDGLYAESGRALTFLLVVVSGPARREEMEIHLRRGGLWRTLAVLVVGLSVPTTTVQLRDYRSRRPLDVW